MMLMAKKKNRRLAVDKQAYTTRQETRLMEALKVLADRNRRTVTAEIALALEAHLAQAGLWPPSESTSQD